MVGEAVAMPSDGDPGEDVLDRLWGWSEQAIERANQARSDRDSAGVAEEAQRRATSARERAALAKHWELAAHRRAIELHQDAARLQERLGHADRAAAARVRAQHARELYELARQEQQEQARATAGR
jgi:hypothetical protein